MGGGLRRFTCWRPARICRHCRGLTCLAAIARRSAALDSSCKGKYQYYSFQKWHPHTHWLNVPLVACGLFARIAVLKNNVCVRARVRACCCLCGSVPGWWCARVRVRAFGAGHNSHLKSCLAWLPNYQNQLNCSS